MENKLAVIAITITNTESIERVNAILHDFRDNVLGRMGIPLQDRGVSVISIILDAPQESINSLSGKLGMLDGVNSKVLTAK
ncbi:MAG: iron-only hydrogenase system regulator [Clostridiales bacterium]|nr:iron-only hydrogenase system regulator [Clostridiales bacterium]